MVPWFGPFIGIEIAVCAPLTSEEAALTTVCMQWTAEEAFFDRMMPEMLALLQSGEHHDSRQKAENYQREWFNVQCWTSKRQKLGAKVSL